MIYISVHFPISVFFSNIHWPYYVLMHGIYVGVYKNMFTKPYVFHLNMNKKIKFWIKTLYFDQKLLKYYHLRHHHLQSFLKNNFWFVFLLYYSFFVTCKLLKDWIRVILLKTINAIGCLHVWLEDSVGLSNWLLLRSQSRRDQSKHLQVVLQAPKECPKIFVEAICRWTREIFQAP